VGEVDENLKSFADNVVTFFSANARDQAHAAGIVFIPWMIKPLRGWCVKTGVRGIHGAAFSMQDAFPGPKDTITCDSRTENHLSG
jgi:hypothetical protein